MQADEMKQPPATTTPKEPGTAAPEFRVQIKNVDMPEEMQQRAVELGKGALAQALTPREIAGTIKREFDRVYGPAWHCIVGKAFGSFVTHGTSGR